MPRKEFAGAKRTKIPSVLEGHKEGSRGTKKNSGSPKSAREGICGSEADENTFRAGGALGGESRNLKKQRIPGECPGRNLRERSGRKYLPCWRGTRREVAELKKTADPLRVPGKEFAGAKRTKIPSALEGH